MVAKRLAFMHLGNMQFNHRRIESVQRIENSDRCMRESARIDNKPAGNFTRLVNPVNDLIFPVRLVETQFQPVRFGDATALALDIRQCDMAINTRLAFAKQIEIGAVQNENQA